MKKILCLILMLLTLVSCNNKDDVLRLGTDFKITHINKEEMTLEVESLEERDKEKIYLLCRDVPVIYCNYETNDLKDISFDDLIEGDNIIVAAYEKDFEELKKQETEKYLKITQIQLGTQRMN